MKIAIAGSAGRMGRTLIEAVLKDGEMHLAAALEQADSAFLGKDAGELVGAAPCGIAVNADFDTALAGVDCLIDFTRPAGTIAHLAACRRRGVAMVIGTTGIEMEHKLQIQDASRDIPIVFAPNMAIGVNLVFKLLDMVVRLSDRTQIVLLTSDPTIARWARREAAHDAVALFEADGVAVV